MMYMSDPLQVKYWEKKLGRKLTEAEKTGINPVKYGMHEIYLELTQLYFPYDLMEKVILLQLNRKPRFKGDE